MLKRRSANVEVNVDLECRTACHLPPVTIYEIGVAGSERLRMAQP